MLLDHIPAEHLVSAHTDALVRKSHPSTPTPFFATVDERGAVLASVTKRYRVQQPREMVSAVDMALDAHGVVGEVRASKYAGGRFSCTVALPELGWQTSTRSSKVVPELLLSTDHACAQSVRMLGGLWVSVCENGMVVGEVIEDARHRHTKSLDVFKMAQKVVGGLRDWAEVERVCAEELAKTWYPLSKVPSREAALEVKVEDRKLLQRLLTSAPARYEDALGKAIIENGATQGDNLWALTQAVTEVSTHVMRGVAAEVWGMQAAQAIRLAAANN